MEVIMKLKVNVIKMTLNFYDWFIWYKNLDTNEVIGDDVYSLYSQDDPDMEDWVEISSKEAEKLRNQQEVDDCYEGTHLEQENGEPSAPG
jgi:hypothetical protein